MYVVQERCPSFEHGDVATSQPLGGAVAVLMFQLSQRLLPTDLPAATELLELARVFAPRMPAVVNLAEFW